MGNTTVEDMMLGALNCPFGTGHMGVTAENVASEYGISREDQDSFSLESQLKPYALEKGYFKNQIVMLKSKIYLTLMSTQKKQMQKVLKA